MAGPERELFYRGYVDGRLKLMVAALRTGPEPEVLSRRALLPMDEIAGASPHANYAVSPDGRSFVLVRRARANQIVVLQNCRNWCGGSAKRVRHRAAIILQISGKR